MNGLPTRVFELALGMPTAGVTTDTLDLQNGLACGILFATPWAGTVADVYVPDATGTLRRVYNSSGTAVQLTVAVNRYVALDPTLWRGINQFALVSNASESDLAAISVHTVAR